MEVTLIKKSLVSKTLNEVYIDDEYAFSLYANNLKALGIKEGINLTKEKITDVIEPVIYKNALRDALGYIAKVNCTQKQVLNKLSFKKYPEKIIGMVMDYIEKSGFVDDYEYALSFAKLSVRKGKGEKYISFELLKKGVNEDIIKEVISLCCEEADLLPLAEKRLNVILKGKEKPDYKDLNKLKEYLIRQGYGYEKVSETLSLICEKYED